MNSLMYNRKQLAEAKKLKFLTFSNVLSVAAAGGSRLPHAAQKTIEICFPAAAAAEYGRSMNVALEKETRTLQIISSLLPNLIFHIRADH